VLFASRLTQEPITSAPPEVRCIIERVVQAEKYKLYMKILRNYLSGAEALKLLQSNRFTL
jgi:hypothetical protein